VIQKPHPVVVFITSIYRIPDISIAYARVWHRWYLALGLQ